MTEAASWVVLHGEVHLHEILIQGRAKTGMDRPTVCRCLCHWIYFSDELADDETKNWI
jgi:hypothetical protein